MQMEIRKPYRLLAKIPADELLKWAQGRASPARDMVIAIVDVNGDVTFGTTHGDLDLLTDTMVALNHTIGMMQKRRELRELKSSGDRAALEDHGRARHALCDPGDGGGDQAVGEDVHRSIQASGSDGVIDGTVCSSSWGDEEGPPASVADDPKGGTTPD